METFVFTCRCGNRAFEVQSPAPSRSIHLLWGVMTLGLWLLVFALYRLVHLFRISKCPHCGKHSRSVFWILVILVLLTVEMGRVLHYFLIAAPQQIVADASLAELPPDLDVNKPMEAQDLKQAFGFVWVFAALPTAGMLISMYWPYVVVSWLGILTLTGLALPSLYLKRT